MNMSLPLSVLLLAVTGVANAGPCTSDIARAQADLDRRIEAVAGAAPTQPESIGAKLHHQPTPDAVARAEPKAEGGASNEQALAILARARAADERGDAEACRKELSDVRKYLD
jgi:hypothetical protein